MESSELNSLITWVGTLELSSDQSGHVSNAADLADGIFVADCLASIAPGHFNADFLCKIKRENLVDYRLKASNLKKIIHSIYSYYHEVLYLELSEEARPDENKLAASCDEAETVKLLQLVLGCAINCELKERHIKSIMGLEEQVQKDVMSAIQRLMTGSQTTGGSSQQQADAAAAECDIERQLKEAWDEVHRLTLENEELSQQCHDAHIKVSALQEEKEQLLEKQQGGGATGGAKHSDKENNNDVNSPRSEGSDHSGGGGTLSASFAAKRYKQLQDQFDELTHENYRLEALRDDLRGRCEDQETEIQELHERLSELKSLAENSRKYKDEVDEMRTQIANVGKLESQVELFKSKLEEMGDLKRQLRSLEEKNSTYVQNNFQLEEETKKLGTLRQQVENYRLQIQKLEAELIKESKRADKTEFELSKKTERVSQLEADVEKLRSDKEALREELEEAQLNPNTLIVDPRVKSGSLDDSSVTNQSQVGSPPAEEFLPAHIQEQMQRLQFENKTLRRQQTETESEATNVLSTQLEDEERRRAELESECRLLNGKVMELESRVSEMQALLDKSTDHHSDSSQQLIHLRKKLHEYMDKARNSESEVERKKSQIEQLELKMTEVSEKNQSLKELLAKKEADMNLMEERYKKYLEKAKSVIKTLDPRTHTQSTPDIQALKNQLTDKEKMIQHLEGMQMHRTAAEERLAHAAVGGTNASAGGGGGQSYLARQRPRPGGPNSGRPPVYGAAAGSAASTNGPTAYPNTRS